LLAFNLSPPHGKPIRSDQAADSSPLDTIE